jgi:hypothetical protein
VALILKKILWEAIDPTRWDTLAFAQEKPSVYATYAWLQAVAHHRLEVWLIADEAGDYQAAMPLARGLKFGFIRYGYMPVLTQVVPVLVEHGGDAVAFVQAVGRVLPWHYARIDASLAAPALAELLAQNTHRFGGLQKGKFDLRENRELQLDMPYEGLRTGYSKGIRDNLRLAAKAAVHYQECGTASTAWRFFLEHTRKHIPTWSAEHDYGWVRLCATALTGPTNTGAAKFKLVGWEARCGSEVVATACFVHFQDRVIYLMGSVSAEGKKVGAAAGLLDAVIERYADTELTLDFEGGAMPGSRTFFSGFGAKVVLYGCVRL